MCVPLCVCVAQLNAEDKRKFRAQLEPMDLGTRDRERGWTALHFACHGGHVGAAQLLLAAGAPLALGTEGGALGPASSNVVEFMEAVLAAGDTVSIDGIYASDAASMVCCLSCASCT